MKPPYPVPPRRSNLLRRVLARRTGRIGMWGSLGFLLLAGLAPVLAPYDPDRIGDSVATQHLPPASRLHLVQLRDGGEIAGNEVAIDADGVRLRRGGSWLKLSAFQLRGAGPRDWLRSRLHILGTDHLGRDLLSRLLVGSRISLAVGLLAALAAGVLGGLIGTIAGAAGPRLDAVLMRATDAILCLPRIFLLLLFLSVLPGSVPAVILLLGLTGWMGPCRMVRTEVLSLRERDFILAARALGRGRAGLALHHLLPNVLSTLIVAAGLRVGETMLIEAGLSFLGLGVPPPHATWGNLVSAGRPWLIEAWWVSAFPGLALAAAVLAFNLLGDGLRAALPKAEIG